MPQYARFRFTTPDREAFRARQKAKQEYIAKALAEAKNATVTNNMFQIGYSTGITYACRILDNPNINHVFLAHIIASLGQEEDSTDYTSEEVIKKWNDSRALVAAAIAEIAAHRDEVALAQAEINRLQGNIPGIYSGRWAVPKAKQEAKRAEIDAQIAANQARLARAIEAAKIAPNVDPDACIKAVDFISECVNGVFGLAGTVCGAFNLVIPSGNQIISSFNSNRELVTKYFVQEKALQGK